MLRTGQKKHLDEDVQTELKVLQISPSNIPNLKDNEILHVADQLGLKNRERMTVDQIRGDLMSLTYQLINFLTVPPDQWLEPVLSKEPVVISDDEEFYLTFSNGQLNEPATVFIKEGNFKYNEEAVTETV